MFTRRSWLELEAGADEFLLAVGRRTMELVAIGVDEAFIVKAQRDELDDWMEHFVYPGEANERCREARQWAESQEGRELRRTLTSGRETPW